MAVTKEAVLNELRRVKGPDLGDDIVTLGLVSEIVIHGGRVFFAVSVDPARAQELEPMRQAAEKVVSELDGVEKVMVTLTSEKSGGGAAASSGSGPAPAASGPGAPPPPMAARLRPKAPPADESEAEAVDARRGEN